MNFKHLYYFWVAAKAGGINRAGEQLHTTPQTLSGQIKLLEQWLGRALFRKNGWQGTWVYTVFPYWHFHTRGHEVLGCVSGKATIGFGGDRGIKVEVEAGDVCVIPAGVGHRKFAASDDFLMAGAYPPGQEGNIVRPGQIDGARAAREIAAVKLPETDPISGGLDGVVEAWQSHT